MIALQEELDWQCYRLYGLLTDDLRYTGDDLPELALASEPLRSSWPGRSPRENCKQRGSSGTARRRSPRSRRTGPTPTAR